MHVDTYVGSVRRPYAACECDSNVATQESSHRLLLQSSRGRILIYTSSRITVLLYRLMLANMPCNTVAITFEAAVAEKVSAVAGMGTHVEPRVSAAKL